MAKKDEVVVKKTTTVTLEVKPFGKSTIYRQGGLPWIVDRTDKAVEWLKVQGYKPAEIELVGEKPANWDAVFDSAPPVVEVPVEPVPVILDDSIPLLTPEESAALTNGKPL